ncbi:MAG: hypothetical protein ACYTHN_20355, partial [Planctomycetota bacterium]
NSPKEAKMNRITGFLVLGVLALAPVAGAEDDRQGYVTRLYEVGFLTRAVKDHKHHPLGLVPPDDGAMEPGFEEDRTGFMAVETVMATMQGLTSDWDDPASIQNTETCIIVVHKPEMHTRLDSFLETLRRIRGTTVTCTLRTYRILGPTGLPGGGVFSEKEGEAMISRFSTNKNLQLVRAWSLTGFNGQSVAAWEGSERPFLKDYDVEVAQKAAIADPIIWTIREGISFSIRPTVTESAHVLLDIRMTLAMLMGEVVDKHFQAERLGALEMPRICIQDFETSLLIPDGGVAVIGTFDRRQTVKPVVPAKEGEKEKGKEKAKPVLDPFFAVVHVKTKKAFGG